MKKKILKKKTTHVESKAENLPISKNDEDDVEEDYKVFDMSSIENPVIEPFDISNLINSKNIEKKEKIIKITLDAEKLNNEIVNLRNVIKRAKVRLTSKLIRRKKDFEAKVAKNAGGSEKVEQFKRNANRLGEEIDGLKSVEIDVIAKFAILNQKSLNELNISQETSVSDRIKFKLACHELVVNSVTNTREKYKEFNKTAAFLLQRLGLQYAGKKQQKLDINNMEKTEGSEEDGHEEESDSDEECFDMSDIEMVNSDEEAEEKAAKARRELLLGLIGSTEDSTRPSLKPKERKIVDLEEDEEEMKAQVENGKKTKKVTKKVVAKKSKKGPQIEPVPIAADQTTIVRKIKLADGGNIEKVKKSVIGERKESKHDNDPDEEDNGFFISKTPITKGGNKRKMKEIEVEVKNEKKKKSKKDITGEMHPSWAASQQKKKEMQNAKPCGKKITFDENDD